MLYAEGKVKELVKSGFHPINAIKFNTVLMAIAESDIDIKGIYLFEIPLENLYCFHIMDQYKCFDLYCDGKEVVPGYVDEYSNWVEAESINDAIKNYCYGEVSS